MTIPERLAILKASLELNPSSETSGAAREALEKLAPASAKARAAK